VIDEVAPVLDEAGGEYELEEFDVYGESVQGIAVYGNHVPTKPVSGEYADSWVELIDAESGSSLGFIEKARIEPLPEYSPHAAIEYIVRADDPDLLLQPGKTDEKYRLAKYNFHLVKGDIVRAFGEYPMDGEKWLLLGFTTSVEDSGDSGVGMRYAWARASDMAPMEDYAPDNSKADAAWIPHLTRENYEYESPKFERVSDAARSSIAGQGFYIDLQPQYPEYIIVDEMTDLYAKSGEYAADFITTDLFLHSYHLIFDRMLQKLELAYFSPKLRECLNVALSELEKARPALVSSGLMSSYETARDMFSIPLALLGEKPGAGLSDRASSEIEKILEASGVTESEITGATEDYTQYRPRGHYSAWPGLESYFRAMSFLGNAGFALFEDDGPAIPENVRVASLISMILGSGESKWRSFEAPIDFLMGTPDDVAPGALAGIVQNGFGGLPGVKSLADDKKLEAVAAEIRGAVSSPRIQGRKTGNISKAEEESARVPEFRISGKRFTFDAYIFNQLTSPRVGTDENPRNLPEGTDVMAVLGSRAAENFSARNDAVESYSANMRELKSESDEFFKNDATVYTLWLDMLKKGFGGSGSKQFFYNSGAWQWKKLMTASASWAELKHDSILYSKQGGAEMGDGGWYAGKFAPPYPRGYVEPDPQVFGAIIASIDRILAFFDEFQLEGRGGSEYEAMLEELGGYGGGGEEYTDKLKKFRSLCQSAKSIAEKEVAESPLTLEDYGEIKRIARSFTASLILPGGMEIDYGDWEKLRMSIVADVATDFLEMRALHVATGAPRKIFVFANDKSGGPRIARGYAYSYYEFPRPLGDGRMTDEEWTEMVYDEGRADELKALHPKWYGELGLK
jgi:hypothetical protein